jgi:hypothetical protein
MLDLIIMDALDPNKFVEIVAALYNNDRFVRSLYNGLADDGVVGFHLLRIIQMCPITLILYMSTSVDPPS